MVCDAQGKAWTDTIPCGDDAHCVDGVCVICEPGASQCVNTMTAQICTEEGQWEYVPCGEGESCEDGECVACTPGISTCVGVASYILCEDDGNWGPYQGCPDGEVCVGGNCENCTLKQECLTATSYNNMCMKDEWLVWSEEVHCQEDQICSQGVCIYEGCLPTVLLVIDRSSSMEFHWPSVRNSVTQLITDNPNIRFGLYGFPSDLQCGVPDGLGVPLTKGNPDVFTQWFDVMGISLSTPLYSAMAQVSTLAPELLGPPGGAIVLVADGEDTCSYDVVDLSGQLTQFTTTLHTAHSIQTYVIGYSFGSPIAPGEVGSTQLDVIAKAGGTSFDTYLEAANASELNDAFVDVITDWKLCLGVTE